MSSPIVAEVRKLAAERPEHVYTATGMCSYVGEEIGQPGKGEGCIVGQALMRLGVPEAELADIEIQEGGIGVRPLFDLKPEWFPDTNEDEICWLGDVQDQQDNEDPWEQAVQYADECNDLEED